MFFRGGGRSWMFFRGGGGLYYYEEGLGKLYYYEEGGGVSPALTQSGVGYGSVLLA